MHCMNSFPHIKGYKNKFVNTRDCGNESLNPSREKQLCSSSVEKIDCQQYFQIN